MTRQQECTMERLALKAGSVLVDEGFADGRVVMYAAPGFAWDVASDGTSTPRLGVFHGRTFRAAA